jgi:hypothetical protein
MGEFKIKPYKECKVRKFSQDTGKWIGDCTGFLMYYIIFGSIMLSLKLFEISEKIFKNVGGKKDGKSRNRRDNTKWY